MDNFDWVTDTIRAFNYAAADQRNAYAQNFPPMDSTLDEETGELELEFALAGYDPEEIGVVFSGDELKLSGTKKAAEEKKFTILKKGIRTRDFECKYILPPGRFSTELAKASFKNGLLKLSIPPVPQRKPNKLVITS